LAKVYRPLLIEKFVPREGPKSAGYTCGMADVSPALNTARIQAKPQTDVSLLLATCLVSD
jgi:hypothetical protein